ncbi:hypothetical protein O181_005453 [Austropuccinia psidii MF-1]|uniref:Splicing factor 3A subunit 1 n=1 Tax=Austropuccinia psidii MF-1 TaxID=1389203 RepID=A0A9Q3BIA2_9BASI|nr:hypothetical protein [Austropuccinia psidii MF-1]
MSDSSQSDSPKSNEPTNQRALENSDNDHQSISTSSNSNKTLQPDQSIDTHSKFPSNSNADTDIPTESKNELIQSQKYLDGLIYPPPEIRSIVDKTAAFIAKNPNPKLFEEKIRQREKTDTRFSFLSPDDAYNPYYRHRIECIKNGDPNQSSTPITRNESGSIAVNASKADDKDKPPEPTPLQFLIEPSQIPKINSVDLEIIKLTALFTARLGRKFVSDLSQRESRNYQFDFLRPSHSLFSFFNRLVEQYTKVLIPTPETITRLENLAGGKAIDRKRLDITHANQLQKVHTVIGKRAVMSETETRINWERYQGLQLQKKTSEEEKEKKEFNEIDWEDFIVVSTVEFTENDEVIDLPPPMSISEVENMTIAQKKMAAMLMEGKEVTSITEEQLAIDDQTNDLEASQMLEEAKRSAEEAKARAQADGQVDVEEDEHRIENKQTAEIKKLNKTGMKIRKDYVPKSKQNGAQQNGLVGGKIITTLCQICGQQINVNEISEHVRIELLDPRWKEKKQKTEVNRSSSNMLTLGSDVSSSLRDLAKSRLDIFEENVTEEEKQRREAEQKKLKQLAKEKYTWDGHLNTGERITNIYQTGANLDEQIQALHRSKGLTGESIHSGPQIGPLAGAMPPQPPSSQPNPALLQQQQALQLQQQQIDLHIKNITSGLTASGEPLPRNLPHLQPSFGGGATLSAAPQPIASRPPLIDPGRAAMINGSMPPPGIPPHTGAMTPMPLGSNNPSQPPVVSLLTMPPPGTEEHLAGKQVGIPPNGIVAPHGAASFPVPPGLPGRPNVPDFGAGIPGPPLNQQGGVPLSGTALTPMAAQLAIDNITGQATTLGGSTAPPEGLIRPAEDDGPEGQPGTKKMKLGPNEEANVPPIPAPAVPQLFTEEQWLEMHPEPISLVIKLPVYPEKPEWGCDGSEVALEEIPITLLVGVLRDKLSHLKGIPVGRQQIKLGNKILPNQVTLASLNFKSGDKINLGIKEQRKK